MTAIVSRLRKMRNSVAFLVCSVLVLQLLLIVHCNALQGLSTGGRRVKRQYGGFIGGGGQYIGGGGFGGQYIGGGGGFGGGQYASVGGFGGGGQYIGSGGFGGGGYGGGYNPYFGGGGSYYRPGFYSGVGVGYGR